jgi:hypothetical protein
MRYWKPWQPPDSTATRSARFGFWSFSAIAFRRCDARGVMLMVRSLPSSSLRGFLMAFACLGVEADNARRWILGARSFRRDRMLKFVGLLDCHDGARKSKNSGCCDCTLDALKLRTAATGAHVLYARCGEGSALRHLLVTFIVVAMIGVGCGCGCVS